MAGPVSWLRAQHPAIVGGAVPLLVAGAVWAAGAASEARQEAARAESRRRQDRLPLPTLYPPSWATDVKRVGLTIDGQPVERMSFRRKSSSCRETFALMKAGLIGQGYEAGSDSRGEYHHLHFSHERTDRYSRGAVVTVAHSYDGSLEMLLFTAGQDVLVTLELCHHHPFGNNWWKTIEEFEAHHAEPQVGWSAERLFLHSGAPIFVSGAGEFNTDLYGRQLPRRTDYDVSLEYGLGLTGNEPYYAYEIANGAIIKKSRGTHSWDVQAVSVGPAVVLLGIVLRIAYVVGLVALGIGLWWYLRRRQARSAAQPPPCF